MPVKANRPCHYTGCGALVDSGYCDTHCKPAQHQRERWRGSPASRGYDSVWKRKRLEALKRDCYLCQSCLHASPSRVTPAQDVDHILSIATAPDLRLDLSNLQSLCRDCHAKKTATDNA